MHVLKHRDKKPAPLVPIVSVWKVPGVRKMRGKRFNVKGEYVGPCGPPKPVPDVTAQKAVREAYAAAARMGPIEEGGGFDLATFTPYRDKILVVRGPWIKEEGGVLLPESKWRHEPYYFVIRVGPLVRNCSVGDRVLFQKKHRPKDARLGGGGFYISRDAVVVGIVEPV